MRRFIKSITLAVISFLILSLPAYAVYETKNQKNDYSQQQLDERFQQIHSVMRKVHEGKLNQEDALKILDKMKVHPIKGQGTKTVTSTTSEIGISSVPDYAIDLPQAFALWDDLTGYYYAGAHFFWNAKAYWQADFPSPWPAQPGIGVDIGGPDGFGLVFSRPINRVTQTFDTYSSSGQNYSYTFPSSASNYGVGFTKQDWGVKLGDGSYGYNWDSGYMGVYFTPQQPGQQMSIWQEMAHTWSTTSVSITGINYVGISWNFSVNENKWQAVAPYAIQFTPY